jgi:hypothetical protein
VAIFIGNVSSLKLVKTKKAKSVLVKAGAHSKHGWNKCAHAGIVYEETNESYTPSLVT